MQTAKPDVLSIRTITAGIHLEAADDLWAVEEAARFLDTARGRFEDEGLQVQSTRIATQPLAPLCRELGPVAALAAIQKLDRTVADLGSLVSVGPLVADDVDESGFPSWAAEMVAATKETYFSVTVADAGSGLFHRSIGTAAATIRAISQAGDNGEANFRFGAAARVPASTPFFPVAYHAGPPAFSIGLESAGLVSEALPEATGLESAAAALGAVFERRLQPIQTLAEALSEETVRRYIGIDLSPAPSLEASIAEPIEKLTGQPFGAPTTLAACAAITRGLQSVALTSCGYSGLMLPLLEDRVLAQRATEGRFGVRDLLVFSTVCGTGLDVIPLPGETRPEDLAGVILDMATLATRLGKPLAARLLPIPGRTAGDVVEFANPHLTRSVVLPVA